MLGGFDIACMVPTPLLHPGAGWYDRELEVPR